MSASAVDALVSEGVIERVREDLEAARADLAAAHAHLESAAAIADADLVGAFSLAYDSMRKSIVAHMRANGLRVMARTGAHYQTGRYGLAALGGSGVDDELRAFDTMRAATGRSTAALS